MWNAVTLSRTQRPDRLKRLNRSEPSPIRYRSKASVGIDLPPEEWIVREWDFIPLSDEEVLCRTRNKTCLSHKAQWINSDFWSIPLELGFHIG